jgi:hypothetical protein
MWASPSNFIPADIEAAERGKYINGQAIILNRALTIGVG